VSAREPKEPAVGNSVSPVVAAVTAWLLPGCGHLLLRRRGRALTYFLVVGGLAITGFLLRGNVFQLHSTDPHPDPFNFLGALADLGSGIFYYLARFFEKGGPDVSRATGDYGTRFIATAGVVNLLFVLDAYGIASKAAGDAGAAKVE
jgi:hypothetical protein